MSTIQLIGNYLQAILLYATAIKSRYGSFLLLKIPRRKDQYTYDTFWKRRHASQRRKELTYRNGPHLSWRRQWQPNSSILAWEIPWMEEPGRLQSMRSLRGGHDWATFTFMHWRRNWQPNSSILAWEIPWTEEPGGLQSTRSQESDMDWNN